VNIRIAQAEDWTEIFVDGKFHYANHSIPDHVYITLLEQLGAKIEFVQHDELKYPSCHGCQKLLEYEPLIKPDDTSVYACADCKSKANLNYSPNYDFQIRKQ
jgi:hypothetical protein